MQHPVRRTDKERAPRLHPLPVPPHSFCSAMEKDKTSVGLSSTAVVPVKLLYPFLAGDNQADFDVGRDILATSGFSMTFCSHSESVSTSRPSSINTLISIFYSHLGYFRPGAQQHLIHRLVQYLPYSVQPVQVFRLHQAGPQAGHIVGLEPDVLPGSFNRRVGYLKVARCRLYLAAVSKIAWD